MWMSLERSLDGVVGRMLSWLAHPPLHSVADVEQKTARPQAVAEVAEPASKGTVEPGPELAATEVEALVDVAGKKKGSERAEPVADEVEAFVEAGRRGSAEATAVARAPAEASGTDERLRG